MQSASFDWYAYARLTCAEKNLTDYYSVKGIVPSALSFSALPLSQQQQGNWTTTGPCSPL